MPDRVVHIHIDGERWIVACEGHPPRAVRSVELAVTYARDLVQGSDHGEVRLHLADGSTESEFHGEERRSPDRHARSHEAARTHLDIDRIRERHPGSTGPFPGLG